MEHKLKIGDIENQTFEHLIASSSEGKKLYVITQIVNNNPQSFFRVIKRNKYGETYSSFTGINKAIEEYNLKIE